MASPRFPCKKKTKEFVFFAFLLFTAKNPSSFVHWRLSNGQEPPGSKIYRIQIFFFAFLNFLSLLIEPVNFLTWWGPLYLDLLFHENLLQLTICLILTTNAESIFTWNTLNCAIADTLPPEMFGGFGSVWCKMPLGEVGVSLPWWCHALVFLAPG